MKCSTCKKGNMIKSYTTYYKKVNDKYFIIENVPCFKCENCGEVTFSLQTLNKIEELIDKSKTSEKANIMQYDLAA